MPENGSVNSTGYSRRSTGIGNSSGDHNSSDDNSVQSRTSGYITHSSNSTSGMGTSGLRTSGRDTSTSETPTAGESLANSPITTDTLSQGEATLTNGNAGRFPAAGYVNRTELATALIEAKIDTARALGATPFGPNALSTQQLTAAANSVKTVSRAAGVAGSAIGPAVGAYEGYQSSPAQASTGERLANMIGGGLKEVDDSIVSVVAGGVTAAGTIVAGGMISSGGVTAPAGIAVIASAPATGTAASIGAAKTYDDTTLDNTIDHWVDNTVEPIVATGINNSIQAYESTKSLAGKIVDRINSWF